MGVLRGGSRFRTSSQAFPRLENDSVPRYHALGIIALCRGHLGAISDSKVRREGRAPLRGLRQLRPLEVSHQPPDFLPGISHHSPQPLSCRIIIFNGVGHSCTFSALMAPLNSISEDFDHGLALKALISLDIINILSLLFTKG